MASETPVNPLAFQALADRAIARAFGYPLPGATQVLALTTGAVTTSTVLPAGSTVQITSKVDCFVQFSTGTPGTASATADMFLPASTPITYTLGLNAGVPYIYVSAIADSSAGNLYVTQMAGA